MKHQTTQLILAATFILSVSPAYSLLPAGAPTISTLPTCSRMPPAPNETIDASMQRVANDETACNKTIGNIAQQSVKTDHIIQT